ncbi:MAG: PD40 domain-containing protein [Anaerolineae bacterium]|nr:PD40 domain-containing protein [Anaerolineae bacterium]
MKVAEPPPPTNSLSKAWLIGLTAAGLVTLMAIGGAAFLAYSYLINSRANASFIVPVFADEPTLNHIAFTGNDNNVWLVSPSGQNLRRLTEDGRGYRFPTWSPDGTQLAFLGRDEANDTVLYVSPTSQAAPTIVYQAELSNPFYLYWAPNSQAVTFLTQEPNSMSMRLADVKQPENSRLLEKGAPFYWAWSPQGDRLLMHVGGSRDTSAEAHLSFLPNRQDAQRVELDLAPGGFQAPMWSSDGQSFFYVGDSGEEEAIYKTNVETLEQSKVTNVDGFAFMILSPDDEHIAYLQFEAGTRPPFGRAYLIDPSTTNRQQITDDLIASMYWSPDGKKLALLSVSHANEGPSAGIPNKIAGMALPLRQRIYLRWWIYEVETGTLEPLTSFPPTDAFLQTIPYFDQYYHSLTFWSPDSRYFVVVKREDETDAGQVWVYDTTTEESARQIGEGRLAVWSWR